MVKLALQVYEFDCIAVETDKVSLNGVTPVPLFAFQYLKQICLNESVNTQFLRLKNLGSTEVLQFQNYAGVILTPDGTQIEVLPKIAKQNSSLDNASRSRAALLNMLKDGEIWQKII